MSQQTFEENAVAIIAGVDALLVKPKSRTRFRLAALYERDTGELLAEVFRTNYGPVVLVHNAPTVDAIRGRAILPLNADQRFGFAARRGGPGHIVHGTDLAWFCLIKDKQEEREAFVQHFKGGKNASGGLVFK